MRALLLICTAALVLGASAGSGEAGEERSGGAPPTKQSVSTIAQLFVLQHHASGAADKPRLSFQEADVHAQDKPGKWAVLGGYMAFASGRDPSPHAYGLTMRQTCPRHDDPECWALEKLLIDQQLIVDK